MIAAAPRVIIVARHAGAGFADSARKRPQLMKLPLLCNSDRGIRHVVLHGWFV